MKIILISGDGQGAGKTTLARKLSEINLSLADQIRHELKEEHPDVDFFDKSQAAKQAIVAGTGNSMRTLLIERGQAARDKDPLHWVNRLVQQIKDSVTTDANDPTSAYTVTVDDIRYENEVITIREAFSDVVHMHVCESLATYEPQYENNLLSMIANYRIIRG